MTGGRKLPKVEKDCVNIVFYRVRKYFMFYYAYTEGRKRVNLS
jgi:hypothetical protein